MADFESAIGTILAHEGGFANNPADPGGATNYGISLRYLKQQGLLGDFDGDGDVDIDDIIAMEQSDAERIYRAEWWDKYRYSDIQYQSIATKVFDMAVNMGGRQAHRLLQRALWDCQQSLDEDGIIGPRTLAAVNASHPAMLIGALRANQRCFYIRLIERKPSLAQFKNGWLRRARA